MMFVPRIVSFPKKKADDKLLTKARGSTSKNFSVSEDHRMVISASPRSEEKLHDSKSHCIDDRRSDYDAVGTSTGNVASSNLSRQCDTVHDVDSCDDGDDVVELSSNQRWPKVGEPICTVCGRYGAYICDRTERDVCSIECKRKNLGGDIERRFSSQLQQDENSVATQTPPLVDDGENIPKDCDNLSLEDFRNDSEAFSTFFDRNYTYKHHHTVQKFTKDNINFLREKLEIKVQGDDCVALGLEFDHFLFPSVLADNLRENNYILPTPIQMQAIPIALNKRDLLACAQTGTGKSASFLLPIIARISSTTDKLPSHHKCCSVPLAIILGPTRELCMQIEVLAKLFCKGLRNMKTGLIVGGNPLPQQLHRLGQGIQILIATPGRLNDIIERHSDKCDLSYVQIFVIDEVDTMLQLGFQLQVNSITNNIPKSCQKMMFSATIPSFIEKLATEVLSNPIFLSVGPPSTPNRFVKQIILWVEERSKKKRLFDLISDGKHFIPPVVIFVGSKIGADMLADALNKVCSVPCASLHSDKPQQMRTQILQDFQNGSYQALVSTSVLGRGIDLLNVVMVVNFDMPSTIDEYIHQVGRAGKLNKTGFAISFINNSNKDTFLHLFELCKDSSIKLPVELVNSPFLKQLQERQGRKIKKRKNEAITTGNLMDLLKEYNGKKRK